MRAFYFVRTKRRALVFRQDYPGDTEANDAFWRCVTMFGPTELRQKQPEGMAALIQRGHCLTDEAKPKPKLKAAAESKK